MEIAELAEQLERATRAVEEGEAQVQRQRDLISHLKKAGEDTDEAGTLLKTLLERQAKRQQHLAQVMRLFPPKS